MEAATAPGVADRRELASDKAARIVDAMRVSVAARGIAGSTFDHVAREAGVSRGLLHYYFGTKERLLVEVVRRECDLRSETLEEAIDGAASAEEVLGAMVRSFEDFLGAGPTPAVMFYEMLTLAQRNEEIAGELAELGRRIRSQVEEALRTKTRGGSTGAARRSRDRHRVPVCAGRRDHPAAPERARLRHRSADGPGGRVGTPVVGVGRASPP